MQELTPADFYYPLNKVAEMLSVSERWVAAQCRDGKIEAVKIGKEWRVSGSAIEKFIKERTK